MAKILVLADEPWVRNEVHAALSQPEYSLIDHEDPETAAQTVRDAGAAAVITDLQVGSMGGVAVTHAVRDTTSDRPVPVIVLLDRAADVFLARRAGAAGWITKPFTAQQLRATLATALGDSED